MKINSQKTTFEPACDPSRSVVIWRVDAYQPGVPKLDHYCVDTVTKESSHIKIEEFANWGEVTRALDKRFNNEFSSKFPGVTPVKLSSEKLES